MCIHLSGFYKRPDVFEPTLKKWVLFCCFVFFFPRLTFFSWISMSECRWGLRAHLDSVLRLGLKGKLKTSTFRAAQEADKASDGPTKTGADMCRSRDDVPVVKWKAENCTMQLSGPVQTVVVRNLRVSECSPGHFLFQKAKVFWKMLSSLVLLIHSLCAVSKIQEDEGQSLIWKVYMLWMHMRLLACWGVCECDRIKLLSLCGAPWIVQGATVPSPWHSWERLQQPANVRAQEAVCNCLPLFLSHKDPGVVRIIKKCCKGQDRTSILSTGASRSLCSVCVCAC